MIFTIKNELLTVDVNSKGAELWSIRKDNVEYLWQGDSKFWGGRATNIFPTVGRSQDGIYTFEGKEYPMGSQGIARNHEFVVEEEKDNKLTLSLTSSEVTKENYPFEFKYFLTYEIKDNTLYITSKMVNTDNKELFFGLGGHTGFIVPLEDSTKFEDYYLEFDEPSMPTRINVSASGFTTTREVYNLKDGKLLPLERELFDDDVIVFENISKGVKMKSDKSQRSVYVKYPDMTYLGLWQPAKIAPDFLCIEPWTSLAGRDGVIEDFSTHESLLPLEAGKEYSNTWSVEIN